MGDIILEPAIAYGKKLSAQEYLNMTPEDGVRYEYWNGELVAMAGTSLNHNRIAGNLYNALRIAGKGKECQVFISDINVSLKQDSIFVLPDIIYTCDEEDKKSSRIIKNPKLLIEVISDSTEVHDRKRKWDEYRQIRSLRYYLMVRQDQFMVEMYSRKDEKTLFAYQAFEGKEALIPFDELGITLSLADIYDGVVLN